MGGEMRRFIAGLSMRAEFTIVVVGAFGYPVLGSVLACLVPGARPAIADADLWALVILESVLLAALAAFLSARGWTLARIGLRPSAAETLTGLGLLVTYYMAVIVLWQFYATFVPHMARAAASNDLFANNFGMLTVIAVSIVNPVFEELFLCGYLISALEDRTSVWTPIHISVGIRVVCHLYQGPWGALAIMPMGLIFALYYVRFGRLWPLIAGHAAMDLIGLTSNME
jgi:membrane protease YdiL (CAAX protease family)